MTDQHGTARKKAVWGSKPMLAVLADADVTRGSATIATVSTAWSLPRP